MNNSLAEVHPELVSEWSEKNIPLTPDDITFTVYIVFASLIAVYSIRVTRMQEVF